MTQPAVAITQLDGALGVLPASAGALLAIIGPASDGPTNEPATFGRAKDVINTFGRGPMPQAAALHIERTGKPVVVIRTATTTAGAAGTVDVDDVDGTSVITVDVDPLAPYDDFDVVFEVVTGGTIGVAGITFKYSLDGGHNYSPVTALGTANTYTIPNSGVVLNFAAGTLVAADEATFRTTAPQWSAAELGAALDALGQSAVTWEIVEIVGPLDGTSFDTVETKFAGFFTRGKYHAWMGHFRMPTDGESEATYLAAFNTAFGSKSTTFGTVCYGACDLTSAVDGRKYRRPPLFAVASREAASSHEVNAADTNLGALVGVSIRDANGNPRHHDETLNPGPDDARAYVLRTWDNGPQGVYVNRPRLLSAAGSDFELLPHRRVMNIALSALRAYFIRRLSKPIQVDATTGFILEEEALDIEAGAEAAMTAVLLAKPKASGIQFALSRTDNLLSTKTLTGDARIIPLGYPEFINLSVGFLNPALQVRQAA